MKAETLLWIFFTKRKNCAHSKSTALTIETIKNIHLVLVPVPHPEAEFLDVFGTKVLRVFLLDIYSLLY